MINSAPRPRVAFQGAPGAFSEDAALMLLGPDIELVPRATFAALFSSVPEGMADYAVAPVENSLIGIIGPVAVLLRQSDLVNGGEIVSRIQQHLIGCQGAALKDVETVESHPAALAQCRRFLAANPQIVPVDADDTAASVARILKSGDHARAAIASRRAAELYGGFIIKENLEDDPDNYTRFVLLHSLRNPKYDR